MSQIFGGNQQGNINTGDSLLDILSLGFLPAPARANRENAENRNMNARNDYLESQARLMETQADRADPLSFLSLMDRQQGVQDSLVSEWMSPGSGSVDGPKPMDPNKERDSFANTLAKGYKAGDDAYNSTLKSLGTYNPMTQKVEYSPEAVARAEEVGARVRTDYFRGVGFSPEEMARVGASGGGAPTQGGETPSGGGERDEPSLAGRSKESIDKTFGPGSQQVDDPVMTAFPNADRNKVNAVRQKDLTSLGALNDQNLQQYIKNQPEIMAANQSTPQGRVEALLGGATEGLPNTGLEADLKTAPVLEQRLGFPIPKGTFTLMDVLSDPGSAQMAMSDPNLFMQVDAVTNLSTLLKKWRMGPYMPDDTVTPDGRVMPGSIAANVMMTLSGDNKSPAAMELAAWGRDYMVPIAERIGSSQEQSVQGMSDRVQGEALRGVR